MGDVADMLGGVHTLLKWVAHARHTTMVGAVFGQVDVRVRKPQQLIVCSSGKPISRVAMMTIPKYWVADSS